jgi:hypothetical protein
VAQPVEHGEDAEGEEAERDNSLHDAQGGGHRDNFTAKDSVMTTLAVVCLSAPRRYQFSLQSPVLRRRV